MPPKHPFYGVGTTKGSLATTEIAWTIADVSNILLNRKGLDAAEEIVMFGPPTTIHNVPADKAWIVCPTAVRRVNGDAGVPKLELGGAYDARIRSMC
jgi:hypothetical protein